jgi:hypothetical protein
VKICWVFWEASRAASGGRGGGGNRGGGGGQGGNRGGGGGGGNFGGGGNMPAANFLTGQQGGISRTNALGLNYSDNWGKKWKVSGSYFFNDAKNENTSELARTFFTTEGTQDSFIMKDSLLPTITTITVSTLDLNTPSIPKTLLSLPQD